MVSRREFLLGRFAPHDAQLPPSNATATNPATKTPRLAEIGPGCIAYTQNVVCRSCGDVCDEAAIRFSPRLGGAALPVVLAERCTGCGACLSVCPTGAITVR